MTCLLFTKKCLKKFNGVNRGTAKFLEEIVNKTSWRNYLLSLVQALLCVFCGSAVYALVYANEAILNQEKITLKYHGMLLYTISFRELCSFYEILKNSYTISNLLVQIMSCTDLYGKQLMTIYHPPWFSLTYTNTHRERKFNEL